MIQINLSHFKSSGYGSNEIKSKLIQSDARKYLIFVLKRIQTCCISKKFFCFQIFFPKYVIKYLFKVVTYYKMFTKNTSKLSKYIFQLISSKNFSATFSFCSKV